MNDVLVVTPFVYTRPVLTSDGLEIQLDRKGALLDSQVDAQNPVEGEGVNVWMNGELLTSSEFIEATGYDPQSAEDRETVRQAMAVWPRRVSSSDESLPEDEELRVDPQGA